MNRSDEIRAALTDANEAIAVVNRYVGNFAELCRGRLRQSHASNTALSDLKRELADWNIHTGKWKAQK
jgi:hypothetical protein